MDSWHSRPQADLFQELDARPGGLTRRQAEERLARYGPNQLEPPRRPGLLSRVMAQMKDPMILVLLAAAAWSVFRGLRADFFWSKSWGTFFFSYPFVSGVCLGCLAQTAEAAKAQ